MIQGGGEKTNHEFFRQAFRPEFCANGFDVLLLVVRPCLAATENDVGVRVAL